MPKSVGGGVANGSKAVDGLEDEDSVRSRASCRCFDYWKC